jgi:cell division septum initiation protein DivIVA
MSIREQEAPEFAHALRGYEREQVDEYVTWLRTQAVEAEEQAARAEAALAQCRRELASSPTTAGISQRLAAMLQLATEEADDIRTRARTESDATVREAEQRATRTVDEANRVRDAIQLEIDELSATRDELLQRLIALGGDVVGAAARFRGFPPGTSPAATPPVAVLYDAEVDVAPDLDLVADEEPTVSER